ncbi:MAG: cation diffusion facilitator family transporter [Rhodopila sp.]|nr:cation diffusion facilitator family transporter [Rhodopila sp.]
MAPHDHQHHHHAHDHHWHDHHAHGHHGHGHHHHAPARMDAAFAAGAAINMAFVLAEAAFGLAANSVALVADAAHNLGDVLALLLGWAAAWAIRRPPTARRTYGWGRGSILAALFNAAVLLIGVGAIGVEAIRRLMEPQPVASGIVMAVAAAGIVVNGGTALLFLRDRHSDLNIRAQFQHLAADALVSAAVVLAALAIRLTGLTWLDPIASLAIVVVIIAGTWSTLRESLDLSLDAVPARLTQQEVNDWLAALPGVREVHDLHIWGLSTTETALTAHLVCDTQPAERSLNELAAALHERFHIGHTTIQIETETDAALCRLRPDGIV